jgi:hypothetical protein
MRRQSQTDTANQVRGATYYNLRLADVLHHQLHHLCKLLRLLGQLPEVARISPLGSVTLMRADPVKSTAPIPSSEA